MANRTILISGARGYFGATACAWFSARGWRVLKATRYPGDDLHFDLDDPEAISRQSLDEPVDVFLHAAAAHEGGCALEPYRSIRQNVESTLAAIDFARREKIPRFVYLSTFHVFGNPTGVLDEHTVPEPGNVYGLSHLHAEDCLRMAHRQGWIDGSVIRPSNLFGVPAALDSFKRWTLTPVAFVKEAFDSGTITLKSSGAQKRNFVAIETVCEAVEKLEGPLRRDLVHLAGRHTWSIRELAFKVAEVSEKVLGRKVVVSFPDGPAIIPGFEFRSRHPEFQPAERASIFEDYVTEFLALLARTAK